MTTQILYPVAPDVGLLDWSLISGSVARYDAIDEGTTNPDESDYVLKTLVGEQYFDNVYESGILYDNVKAYHKSVRVNLGEMVVFPDNDGLNLKVHAAINPSTYYGSPSWGIGSFYSESDYLLDYWTLDDSAGLVSEISDGASFSTIYSPTPISYTTGKQGNAANFGGDSFLYTELTTSSNIRYRLDTNKSFGGWIYNNTSSGDALLFSIGNGSPRGSACTLKLLDGGSMMLSINRVYTDPNTGELIGQSIANVTTTAPAIGEWSFIICVIDITNRIIKISINGENFITQSFGNYVLNANFYNMFLGGNYAITYQNGNSSDNISASYFNGYIDEWAIWDTALTLANIQNIYNSGTGSTYPLDTIVDKKYTTLYDNDGLEIASISPTSISSSGDLLIVDSETPALYEFTLDDESEQVNWDQYDLSNTYIDLQLFTERKYDSIKYNSTNETGGSSATEATLSGGYPWTTPSLALSPDDMYAEAGGGYTGTPYSFTTNDLHIKNFGFSIPINAAIRKVVAKITTKFNHGGTYTYQLDAALTDTSGNRIGNSYVDSSIPNNTKTTVNINNYGVWGAALTPAIVNDTNFGIRIKYTGESDGEAFVAGIDYVTLIITYSEDAPRQTSIHSAIFTLDLTSNGQQLVNNTTPLYLHNNLEDGDTTLYTAALKPSGEVPLHTWGSDNVEATGVPLYIHGGIYDNSGIDLYLQNSLTPADTTLYINGHDNSSGTVPLNIFAKASDSGEHPLFIHGAYSDSDSMNLFIDGYGDTVSGEVALFLWSTTNPGIRDISSLYMKADNSGYYDGNMNLYIQSPVSADITANIPLYISKATPSEGEETTLFIKQDNTESSGDATLYIKSPGTTDGALPIDENMPLFIARDQNYNWLGHPMYIHVAENDSGNTTMFIKNVANTSNNTTLFMPAIGNESGDTSLYVSGF